jgi:hypothetical protein
MARIEKRPLIRLNEILDLSLKSKIGKLDGNEFVAATTNEFWGHSPSIGVQRATYAHMTGETVLCHPGEGTSGPRPVLTLLNLAGSSSSLYLHIYN